MRENNVLLYFLGVLLPPLCTVFLLSHNFLLGGFIVLIASFLFIAFFSPQFRFHFLIGLFFIQNIAFSKGNIIIFPLDIIFIFFTGYILIDTFYKRHTDNREFNKNLKILFSLYLVFFSVVLFSFFCNLSKFDSIIIITSLFYIARFLQLLLMIYMITIIKTHFTLIESVFDSIIIWAVIQLPFGLLQISNGKDMYGTLTAHHGYLGTLLIIPFFLSLYKLSNSLQQKKGRGVTLYYIFASLIILYIIFGTGCRSALLGLFVSLFIFAINILLKKNFKIVIASLIFSSILIFVSLKFTPLSSVIEETFHNSETNGNVDISSLSRFLIWKYTWKNFVEFPLITKVIGIGIGTFPFLEQHFVLWAGLSKFSGAHLNLLHILVETGILGLLSFLIIFSYTFYYLHRFSNFQISRMATLMTIALLLSGLTQETFWFQSSYGTTYLFYIMIITLIFKQINNYSKVNPKKLKSNIR